MIEKITFLLLGWGLGLLSPMVVDLMRMRKEVSQTKVALLNELHELKYRLALAACFIEMRFGKIDKTYLQWVHQIVIGYEGRKPKSSIAGYIETMLAQTDEGIIDTADALKAEPGGGLALTKYVAPLLDSRISALWFFEKKFQILLMEIHAELNFLNDGVDQARYYLGLTFNKLDDENMSRATNNLTDWYRRIAMRAKLTANRIGDLENYLRSNY